MRTGSGSCSALVVASLVMLLGGDALAGFYLEHEAVLPNPRTMKPERYTIRSWHEGRRFKRESPVKNEFVVIDLDKKEVMGINDDKRTYWKMPSEKYRQIALMSLMVMGVQPGQAGDITVADDLFKLTGQEGEIAGRKAYEVKINALMPGGMETSFWLSKEVPIPVSKMVDELRLALGDPQQPGYKKLFSQWSKLEGYPVQSITHIRLPQGSLTTSETLLVYREEKIPPDVFLVPKGYVLVTDPLTEAEAAMMKQMQQQNPAGIGAPLGGMPPAR